MFKVEITNDPLLSRGGARSWRGKGRERRRGGR